MSVRESIDPKSSLWAWLAYDLWFYRTQRGLSLAQTAMIVRVTRGTVSNWEAARGRPSPRCMQLLDKAWGTGGHFERLHLFACAGHDPNWFVQFIQYEVGSTSIKIYHGKTVPALVQTPAYAQAILRAAGRASEAESETEARMSRQGVLKRVDAPYLWTLIDEEVLENEVGGREVMAGQLNQLLGFADEDRICVRVVPRSAGWHPGHDGHFQVLTTGGRDVAYAVAQVAGRLIEIGDEAAILDLKFDQIGALALSRTESKCLIERKLRAYQ